MKILIIFVIVFLYNCENSTDNESTFKEPVFNWPDSIWHNLKSDAPEETKQWAFAIGNWNATITNHFPNGHTNKGTGIVKGYIDTDSLTITRRFDVTFDDGSELHAFDYHKYDPIKKQWTMYLQNDGAPPSLIGTTGKKQHAGLYTELSPEGRDLQGFEIIWNTKMTINSEDEYHVISARELSDGTSIRNAYTAKYIRIKQVISS